MSSANQIARKLMELAPSLFQAMAAAMRSEGVDDPTTLVQLHTLRALGREPRSFKDLCAHRNVAPPTLSRTIEAMVKRGWVERAAHPDDRRQLVLKLTRDGRQELETAGAGTQAHLAEVLSSMSPAERQTVSEALDILDRALRPEGAKAERERRPAGSQ